MAKINFKEFELVTDLAGKHIEKSDLSEPIADAIYKQAAGVKMLDLAMKIFKGEQEYTDEEVDIITKFVEEHFTGMMIHSWRKAIGKEA